MGKCTIRYNREYDNGRAVVDWDGALFVSGKDQPDRRLCEAAAAIAAAANDSKVRDLGRAEFLADALSDALGMEDVCLYGFPRYKGDKAINKTEMPFDMSGAFAICRRNFDDFQLVLIVCRGTESFGEMFFLDGVLSPVRAKWNGIKTRLGFKIYAEKVSRALHKYLGAYGIDAGKAKFMLTGHSLGGAAVQLVASELIGAGYDVRAYTFGALNAVFEPMIEYDGVWNICNALDDYGPNGKCIFKPAGSKCFGNKIGKVLMFEKDYDTVFVCQKAYKNHVMAGYYSAVRDGLII